MAKGQKNRQQNGQKNKDKRTNNDIQNITHKTKDGVSRTPMQTRGSTQVLRMEYQCAVANWEYQYRIGSYLMNVKKIPIK
jgi:hypothetical protein